MVTWDVLYLNLAFQGLSGTLPPSCLLCIRNYQELSVAHRTEPHFHHSQLFMLLCGPAPATTLLSWAWSPPRHGCALSMPCLCGLLPWFCSSSVLFLECFSLIFTNPILPILQDPQPLQEAFPHASSKSASPSSACSSQFVCSS